MRPISVLLALLFLASIADFATASMASGTGIPPETTVGRAAQSWAEPSDGSGGVGDVFNAASWDGQQLGTLWTLSCAVQSGKHEMKISRDEKGTGEEYYLHGFSGGTLFLSKYGPWGDGVNDRIIPIDQAQVIVGKEFLGQDMVSSNVTVWATGQILGHKCPMTFTVQAGRWVADTDGNEPILDYPPLLGFKCEPDGKYGGWYDLKGVAVTFDCPHLGPDTATPAVQSTWGELKSHYR